MNQVRIAALAALLWAGMMPATVHADSAVTAVQCGHLRVDFVMKAGTPYKRDGKPVTVPSALAR